MKETEKSGWKKPARSIGLIAGAVAAALGVWLAYPLFIQRMLDRSTDRPPSGSIFGRDAAVSGSQPVRWTEERARERDSASASTASGQAGGRSASARPKPAQVVTPDMIEAELEVFRTTEQKLRALPGRLEWMAGRSTELNARTVMALVREGLYDTFAIRALGHVRDETLVPEAADLLRQAMRGQNIELMIGALESYGRLLGEDAVRELEAAMAANWRRPDGMGEIVCAAAAAGLAEAGTESALRALLMQLARVDEPDWLPDYGSKVIEALIRHDAVNTESRAEQETRRTYARVIKAGSDDSPVFGLREIGNPGEDALEHVDGEPVSTPTELRGPYAQVTKEALILYAERLRERAARLTSNPVGVRYLEEKADEALKAVGIGPGDPIPPTEILAVP